MTILASDMDFADQVSIPLANTPVAGTAAISSDGGFVVTAHPSNTATVWVYVNQPGASKDNGYPVEVGQHVILAVVRLDMVQFESTAAAQKVCWLKL
jgi:hypothetical protein